MRDLGARAKVRGGRPLCGGIPIQVPLQMALDLANICLACQGQHVVVNSTCRLVVSSVKENSANQAKKSEHEHVHNCSRQVLSALSKTTLDLASSSKQIQVAAVS